MLNYDLPSGDLNHPVRIQDSLGELGNTSSSNLCSWSFEQATTRLKSSPKALIHSHTCSYYTHSNLHTMPMPMVGQTHLKQNKNLRLLWHSYLFISFLPLNSRKVTQLAFPRKWILIYSEENANRLYIVKLTNTCSLRCVTSRFQEHLLRSVSFNFSRISFLVW